MFSSSVILRSNCLLASSIKVWKEAFSTCRKGKAPLSHYCWQYQFEIPIFFLNISMLYPIFKSLSKWGWIFLPVSTSSISHFSGDKTYSFSKNVFNSQEKTLMDKHNWNFFAGCMSNGEASQVLFLYNTRNRFPYRFGGISIQFHQFFFTE